MAGQGQTTSGSSGHKKKHKPAKQETRNGRDLDIEAEKARINHLATTRNGVRVYKIVVIGDGGVGKSAVTLQFVSHNFLDYHDPTIEDSYQQQAVIDGEPAQLDILDTAGQVEFTAMREQYMRCGEGFLICYSVTDRQSFEEVDAYRDLIQRTRATDHMPIVLIGNKFDLQMQRKVTTEEGRTLAKKLGCPFFETSAALRTYIDDAFHSLVREIRANERRKLEQLNANGRRTKHSKWWRLRSILALVFRRKRHSGNL